MTECRYTAEEAAAILAATPPLSDPGMAGDVIASLEAAWRKCVEYADTVSALPPDTQIIRELERVKEVADIAELSQAALNHVLNAAVLFLHKDVFPHPFEMGREWHIDPARRQEIMGLEVALPLVKETISLMQEDRARPPHPIRGPTNYGVRTTKRGRPPDYIGFDFACCCYVVFLCASKTVPTRRIDPATGCSIGPFHDFLGAAIGPTGILDRNRGDRIVRPRVDGLVRDSIAWLTGWNDPGNAEPWRHEVTHFHRFFRLTLPLFLNP